MARDISDKADRPSAWLERFAPLIAPGARVLEIAAGNGRNTAFLARLDCRVTAVDIHPPAEPTAGVTHLTHDLENDAWPFAPHSFDVVVGINYLWRPRWLALCDTLAQGGLFLYETFTEEQALWMGRPCNPEHFLKIGELLCLTPPNWRILAYEDGRNACDQFVQRIAARSCRLKNLLPVEDVRICVPR